MTTITTETTQRATATHKLGTNLTGATTLDQALTRSGLNWGIRMQDATNLSVLTDDGVINTSIPGKRLLMRDDTFATLNVVGSRYTPITNRDFFALAEPLARCGATYAAAGMIGGGRTTFMELSVPDADIKIGGHDLLAGSIVLRAPHDGSGKATADLNLTRLICTNGMRSTIPGLDTHFSVRHTVSAHTLMAEAETVMQGMLQYARTFGVVAETMLDTPFTRTEFGAFVDSMFPRPEEEEGRAVTMWENRRVALMQLFSFAETNEFGRGTRWAAFNAVTEYLDWSAPVRSASRDADTQRALRQFNSGAQPVRNRAFRELSGI